jgi:tRNA U34 5-carboxymethylaminomethyl modifying GTPase MnmE/TrmE
MDFVHQQDIKVLVVGCMCTGKSSFIKKLKNNQYTTIYPGATIDISRETITRGQFNFYFTELSSYFIENQRLVDDADVILYLSDSTKVSFLSVKIFNEKNNTKNKPTLFVRNKMEQNPNYNTRQIEHSMSIKYNIGVEELLGKILEKKC